MLITQAKRGSSFKCPRTSVISVFVVSEKRERQRGVCARAERRTNSVNIGFNFMKRAKARPSKYHFFQNIIIDNIIYINGSSFIHSFIISNSFVFSN